MRSAPFVVGLLLGFSASFFTGCPMNTCTPASCPLGCCDTTGRCQTSANQTCGRNGAACATCSGFDTCVSGVCMTSNTGAGQATGGGGAGGGVSGTGYATFLTNFSNAYCQYAIRCGQLASTAQADCAALLRPYFAATGAAISSRSGGSERAVAAGYSSFDSARAQSCLSQLAAYPCGSSSGPPPDCSGITSPAAAPNGSCFSTADCTDTTLGCNGGTCMRRCTAGGNLGESCRPDGTCTAPFVCAGGVCRNRTPAGSPCTFEAECGAGAFCNSMRVCETLPGIGSPCASFRCVAEAYCSASQCLARKAANAACSFSSECADGLRCTPARVCGPQGAVGDACTSASGDCAPTLFCNSNRQCAVKGPAGAACRSFSDCATPLDCDDVARTCRAYSGVDGGQPCSSTRSCTVGQCFGKVVVFDGGTNTPGTCREPRVGDQCSSNFSCGDAQYCETATMTCRPAGPSTPCSSSLSNCRPGDYCTSSSICATKAAAGQVCDSTRSDSCAATGETCQPTSTPGTSRCQRPPGLGETCTTQCLFPGACVGGTCVASGRVGQPCVPNFPFPCIEGECVQTDGGLRQGSSSSSTTDTCVAARPNGSPCLADQGCQSRYCDHLPSASTGVCAAPCN